MIRFMSDTPYAGVEQEMQHIPGFRPRRSGMVISHLSGCLENQRSLCESHVTDCVPFYELLEVLAEEVAVSTFVNRVCRLTGRRNPCFFQNGHRERFLAMGEKCSRAIEEAATCSAVYLLSADRFLWSRALEVLHFFFSTPLDFSLIKYKNRPCLTYSIYYYVQIGRAHV